MTSPKTRCRVGLSVQINLLEPLSVSFHYACKSALKWLSYVTFKGAVSFEAGLSYSGFFAIFVFMFYFMFLSFIIFHANHFLFCILVVSPMHFIHSVSTSLHSCFPSDVCVPMSCPRLFLYCPRHRTFR